VPGAQLGLMRGAERVTACSGRVASDGPEVTPATAFHAGSLAKALAGLVVLDAARKGKFDLEAPCSDHGPDLWSDSPRALLTQTSGRPNLLPDPDEGLAEFVRRAGAEPLVHAPGRFSYCNAGWCVLDLLLRRTTGVGFEESVRQTLGDLTFDEPQGAAPGHLCLPGQDPVPVPSVYSRAAAAAGATWWATADQLLDFASLHLTDGGGVFDPEDVAAVRGPAAALPGATVFDAWGMGWATWDRGEHHAFGWAGFTGGHRAYLRCFPGEAAAVALVANGAGPLFGPPGGSAMFDSLLPDLLELLGVPPLQEPEYSAAPLPVADLAGDFGPAQVQADGERRLQLVAAPFGQLEPVSMERLGGNTFAVVGAPPGSTPIAFDDDLLYVGPFALPRT